MTGYPNSPQVTKAALISMGAGQAVPRLIVLQYNPEQLSRSLTPQYERVGDTPTGTELLAGPPQETLALQARISAVDQLATGSAIAAEFGIHPQLATLEMMLFPGSAAILAKVAQMTLGVLEVIPPETPLTLFVWGTRRVLPVRMTQYHVMETLYDPKLNPIDAAVDISLDVLTYQAFTPTQAGFFVYMANLAQREVMSALGGMVSGASIVSSILKG
jgi:hypothetical protein